MSVQRKIQAGFFIGLAFLLLTGVTAWWSSARNIETFSAVDHTQQVLGKLQDILVDMLNTETGSRGLVISGDDTFLEPYQAGIESIQKSLAEVRHLTSDNPNQQQLLAALEPLVQSGIRSQAQMIQLRHSGNALTPQQFSATKQTMDAIRKLVSQMTASETQLLQARSAKAQSLGRMTIAIVVSASLAATILVALAGIVVHRDFEKRELAEQERDRFFTLSLDMLCIARSDGYFKRVNPAFTDTLGWSLEEFLTRPFIEFVHPDDIKITLDAVDRQVRAGQKILQFENRYQHKDGSWRWLLWNSVPTADGLMHATARDVTERKRMEAEIVKHSNEVQAVNRQLQEANKELESFSYSVSHDLRAPLRHIQGYVEMLTAEVRENLPAKACRYLKTIVQASSEMSELLDDLLSFSRMGRIEMHQSVVKLDSLLQDSIRKLELATRDRNIEWKFSPLPTAIGDPSMFLQVFANLLGNAVKYTRPRDPAVIEVGCAGEEDERVTLFVRDNGVGFDPKYSHKLFGVFQRLHTSEQFEGTGIGLANVQRIIARHGGRTWAEGKLGEGATFYFTVKRATAQ